MAAYGGGDALEAATTGLSAMHLGGAGAGAAPPALVLSPVVVPFPAWPISRSGSHFATLGFRTGEVKASSCFRDTARRRSDSSSCWGNANASWC